MGVNFGSNRCSRETSASGLYLRGTGRDSRESRATSAATAAGAETVIELATVSAQGSPQLRRSGRTHPPAATTLTPPPSCSGAWTRGGVPLRPGARIQHRKQQQSSSSSSSIDCQGHRLRGTQAAIPPVLLRNF